MKARAHPGARRFRRGIELGKEKYAGSWAEYLWHRLDAVDFMNQPMLLAATLLLCAVPFLLVTAALAGRSVVSELSAFKRSVNRRVIIGLIPLSLTITLATFFVISNVVSNLAAGIVVGIVAGHRAIVVDYSDAEPARGTI